MIRDHVQPVLAVVVVAVLATSTLVMASATMACTAVVLHRGDTVLLAKNLDWELDSGLLVAHPRDAASGRRFASVTCNQLGADRPLAGMNEVGLVIEETSGVPTKPGGRPVAPALDEFRWVQVQLDRHASVVEVLDGIARTPMVPRWITLHYLIADRTGDAAVIEFRDGTATVHRGDDLPVAVLANDGYANSVRYLRGHVGFGGDRAETAGPESPERFVRAARAVRRFATEAASTDPVGEAFAILDAVRQHDTRWSLVHDVRHGVIHVRVAGQAGTRHIDLAALDLAARARTLVMDLAGDLDGASTSRWTPWSQDIEADLRHRVRESLGVSRPAIAAIAAVPCPSLPVELAREPAPSLEVRHVQNAGVWLRHGDRSLLVDALFDLTVADGRPPRLHDHLPADLIDGFLAGGLGLGCVDVAFATHDHDDHHAPGPAARYLGHCRETVLVRPPALGGSEADAARMVATRAGFGERTLEAAGGVRYTALGLRHASSAGRPSDRPHVGYVLHLGPWDVVHLGDAAVSPRNLAVLDRYASPGWTVVLAPWWFLTDPDGRIWLAERSRARHVVALHANRGNRDEIAAAIASLAAELPPTTLPGRRLASLVLDEVGGTGSDGVQADE
jgi:choloylglycine hydrolase